MFHTCAIITGQKTSRVIAVGMACWPKIPTPASTVVPFATGSIFMFRALFMPMMALKVPPRRMLTVGLKDPFAHQHLEPLERLLCGWLVHRFVPSQDRKST